MIPSLNEIALIDQLIRILLGPVAQINQCSDHSFVLEYPSGDIEPGRYAYCSASAAMIYWLLGRRYKDHKISSYHQMKCLIDSSKKYNSVFIALIYDTVVYNRPRYILRADTSAKVTKLNEYLIKLDKESNKHAVIDSMSGLFESTEQYIRFYRASTQEPREHNVNNEWWFMLDTYTIHHGMGNSISISRGVCYRQLLFKSIVTALDYEDIADFKLISLEKLFRHIFDWEDLRERLVYKPGNSLIIVNNNKNNLYLAWQQMRSLYAAVMSKRSRFTLDSLFEISKQLVHLRR
jgi:hypothetical protein